MLTRVNYLLVLGGTNPVQVALVVFKLIDSKTV